MSQQRFHEIIGDVTARIGTQALDGELQHLLTRTFPPGGLVFEELAEICRVGIREGWLCDREQGGIKFGRITKPGPVTAGFSVDVVEMDNVVGPHHRHPHGEIDMIIPESPDARFDGHGKRWLVYEAGSAHKPTVSSGKAIVLYLLPGGAIEFTKS
ncbi:MAG: DUF4863 family protein [Gammaproteobacteria bacterium]